MNAESRLGPPYWRNSNSIAPTGDLVAGNMARAFNDDLRSRVLAASRDGISTRSAASRFGIGVLTAIAWIASAQESRLTRRNRDDSVRRGGLYPALKDLS
ncbi:insertion sequence transposase protein (plasmid) [Agrobacterium tumefaciens]|nr:insertion sequence transposase protein [Agrobacterium tumefaciens]